MQTLPSLFLAAFLSVTLGCSSKDQQKSRDVVPSGGYVVGTTRIEIAAHDGRTLPVQLWYPAEASARGEATTGHPLADLEPPGPHHDTLASLVAAAPDGCTRKTIHAAIDAPAAQRGEPWPVLLFSHCHNCARFSEESVAERLASDGFVVAAPDHVGNTIYEQQSGTAVTLDAAFLAVRGADMRSVLDALLAGDQKIPADLRGHLDATRVGMFGHSFGSVTTGLVLQNDARVKVGVMIAAPPANPLLAGVTLASLTKPGLFFLAEEDNSITALGNQLIHDNFDQYPAPAWLVSVKDAGHWSFSDICNLIAPFKPGCGQGTRQTDTTQTFTYLPNDTGRSIAQEYTSAFFRAELLGDATGADYLSTATPDGIVTLGSHP